MRLTTCSIPKFLSICLASGVLWTPPAMAQSGGALVCTPQSIHDKTMTQLSGTGTAAAVNVADKYHFANVASNMVGDGIDAIVSIDEINNATEVALKTVGLEAKMTPSLNSNVVYDVRLIQENSISVFDPVGRTINQSQIRGVVVEQNDIDSTAVGENVSTIAGHVDGAPVVDLLNTVTAPTLPIVGSKYTMDPAKTGLPTDWSDEGDEAPELNKVTYTYPTFKEQKFVTGLTGTVTEERVKATTINLCPIVVPSADVVANDDNLTATPIGALLGGIAGEVLSNDTINNLPVIPALVSLEVIDPATPQSPGDPVPYLVTSLLSLGQVVVPPSTPPGEYEITYELCPITNSANCDRANIRVAAFDGLGLDFSDAPLNFLVASHSVPAVPTVYLGTNPPDVETLVQSDSTATADDLIGADDEDGVIFPVLTRGTITTLHVEVSGAGYLQAWIDFNGDGIFEEPLSEIIAVNLEDNGQGDDHLANDGRIQVDVSVPNDASAGTAIARFRYSSTPNLPFFGYATDGEVEDYSLIIATAELVDRGDAPLNYGDPRHVVVPDIYLGSALPDTESSNLADIDALGDDNSGVDDEDSVANFPLMVAGTSVPITVQTHELLSLQLALGIPVLEGITYLQMWVDFDQSGSFEPSEHVAIDYRDGGTGDTDGIFNNQISFNIPVPADAKNGRTFTRIRWSTTSALVNDPFDGLNLDGEVEDHTVVISSPDAPFVCNATFHLMAKNTTNGNWSLNSLSVTENSSDYTLQQIQYPDTPVVSVSTSGWGYNELDNYLYSVRSNPRELLRVDGSGEMTVVADLSSLGLEPPLNSTDILPNGKMIYVSQSDKSKYQILDLSDPQNPVNGGILNVGDGTKFAFDIGYNPVDHMVYFIDSSNDLYMLDPNDGNPGSSALTFVGNVTMPAGYPHATVSMTATWFDVNGFMYILESNSGQILVVEVGANGNRPATFQFIEIENSISNIRSSGHDGASCRDPGPFVSSVIDQGSISGTLYEDSDGSDTLNNGEPGLPQPIRVTLYKDRGTPADPSDDILIATTQTSSDGTYGFANVDASFTYRIEVDEADPDLPATYSIGTPNPITSVTVVLDTTTDNQNFGFDNVPFTADLELSKSVTRAADGQPALTAKENEELDFILTVTNNGPRIADAVAVRDLIPDGFSYVSDDATAQGDTFDTGTGIWTLGEVPVGAPHTLTIRVIMKDSGEHTNRAEITASSLPDPDSDPDTSYNTDDLSDQIPDDDEASATVEYVGTGAVLSGTVFFDTGANATAYDGVQGGDETGTDQLALQVLDPGSNLIGSPAIDADGNWSLTLPNGFTDPVTLTLSPVATYIFVSETPQTLPALTNPSSTDGSFTFQPAAETSYANLDFGVVTAARLNLDQQASIQAGQVMSLRHEYLVNAPGTVAFSIANQNGAPVGMFSEAVFHDTDCNGTADTAINAALPVTLDTVICLVVRVSASSAAAHGTAYSFDLVALTSFGATGVSQTTVNTDTVRVESNQGTLELTKTVRNVTQGTAEGISNNAAAGDVLEYRIALANPGTRPATEIIVYDITPPYTQIASQIPSPLNIGGNVVCTSDQAGAAFIGYSGNLRWACSGSFPPGMTGDVTFQVQIAP